MKIHPQEPDLKELYKIRSSLYACHIFSPATTKKIEAIESQINRHEKIKLNQIK